MRNVKQEFGNLNELCHVGHKMKLGRAHSGGMVTILTDIFSKLKTVLFHISYFLLQKTPNVIQPDTRILVVVFF